MGEEVGREHGGVREGQLLPTHSRSLLGKSEFIISQEIINCWADKRHRSAPPETPSKGAVRGGCDKLQLRTAGMGGQGRPLGGHPVSLGVPGWH